MTTPKTAQTLALIAAAQARIAGMVAENDQRQAVGASMAYSSTDFFAEAGNLESLAYEVIQQ